jgi:hypothetical protein
LFYPILLPPPQGRASLCATPRFSAVPTNAWIFLSVIDVLLNGKNEGKQYDIERVQARIKKKFTMLPGFKLKNPGPKKGRGFLMSVSRNQNQKDKTNSW